MASDPTVNDKGESLTKKTMNPIEESFCEDAEKTEREIPYEDDDPARGKIDDPEDLDFHSELTETDDESSTEVEYSTAHESDSTDGNEDLMVSGSDLTDKSEQRSADEIQAPNNTAPEETHPSANDKSQERWSCYYVETASIVGENC